MRIIRIDHVSLEVCDRPRSVAWYRDVLGLASDAEHETPGEPIVLGRPGASLGLFAEGPPGVR